MAASSRICPVGGINLKLTVTLVFIFCLTFSDVEGEGLANSRKSSEEMNWKERKMVLGSRPPGCVNKCYNCRPCIATLVVPSHQKNKGFTFKPLTSHHGRGDDDNDGYYLLSWKCRCGNKLFQP